jgi:hypothetical protein
LYGDVAPHPRQLALPDLDAVAAASSLPLREPGVCAFGERFSSEVVMSRRRDRNEKQKFQLISDFDVLGKVRVIRRISFFNGEEMVKDGIARRVMDDENVGVIGFQMLPAKRAPMDSKLPPLQPSTAALSRKEMDAIAGSDFKGGENLYGVYGPPGCSRTAGMSEQQRMSRMERGLRPEDLVERSFAKLNAWAQIGPALQEVQL